MNTTQLQNLAINERADYDLLVEDVRHYVISRVAEFLSQHQTELPLPEAPTRRKTRIFFFAQRVLNDALAELKQVMLP